MTDHAKDAEELLAALVECRTTRSSEEQMRAEAVAEIAAALRAAERRGAVDALREAAGAWEANEGFDKHGVAAWLRALTAVLDMLREETDA